MDQSLKQVIKQALSEYVGGGINLETFLVSNEEQGIYAVLIIDTPQHEQEAGILVMVRLDNEQVIIEADTTDYPLVDVLLNLGIPRDHIRLAYAGEPLLAVVSE